MKLTKEAIIKQLKEKKLRITAQRVAIIEALIEKREFHPSARLMYREAKKRKKSLSLSTLYAVLKEFSRHGIIKTLQFDQMENRDLKEHINLMCGRCKKILDYRAPIIVDQNGVAKKTGFSITDTRLEYYGCCRECRESKGSNRAS